MKIRLFKPYLSDGELDNIKEVFNDTLVEFDNKN